LSIIYDDTKATTAARAMLCMTVFRGIFSSYVHAAEFIRENPSKAK
jgi:hypothetical protein